MKKIKLVGICVVWNLFLMIGIGQARYLEVRKIAFIYFYDKKVCIVVKTIRRSLM